MSPASALAIVVSLASTAGCKKSDSSLPPKLIKAGDGAVAAQMLAAVEAEPRYAVVAYVGASWCEPCVRFKKALAAGELDRDFANVLFVEFDHDSDEARLDADHYGGELLPRFALPTSDGRGGPRRFEGSIKGPDGVDNIRRQLRELLGASLRP